MARGRYLCTGTDSPIRCGNCGGHFDINEAPHAETYPDGKKRQRYVCKVVSGGCGSTIADRRVLDEIIEDLIRRWLRNPETLRAIREAQEARQRVREPYDREIAERDERKAHWGQLFNQGKVSPEEHIAMVDDLNTGIDAARLRLNEIEAIPISNLDEATIAQILRDWELLSPAEKRSDLRRIWQGFIVPVAPGSYRDDRNATSQRVGWPRPISAAPPEWRRNGAHS